MAVLDEPPAGSPARRAVDRLPTVRVWCQQRANRKCAAALRMVPGRIKQRPHEQIRCKLGLTVGDYQGVRRWFDMATDMCDESPAPMTMGQALKQIADHHVDTVTKLGLLLERGWKKQRIREKLGLSELDWDLAYEWWRDGLAATSPRELDEA